LSAARIVALLSFYDEATEFLHDAIASLNGVADTLVALDGAYALYPNAQPSSGARAHKTIRRAARDAGINLDLIIPTKPWADNEVEKRTALFRHGERHAHPFTDWYLILDSDDMISATPTDLHACLADTTMDVGEVIVVESNPHPIDGKPPIAKFEMPRLFRAIPGIAVVHNHFTYRTPDGRNLWGNARTQRLEPRIPIHELVLEHRTHYRSARRRQAAVDYYRTRDKARVEYGKCTRCDQPATETLHADWRPYDGGYVASWVEACDQHADHIRAENDQQLRDFGLDPDTAEIHMRQGPVPA
jgi:hypothetical protein